MVDRAQTPKRPSCLWRVVLVVSLALNLAVAGIVVGSLVSGRSGPDGPRSFDLGQGAMTRVLEPAERRQIGRNLRSNRALRDMNPREGVSAMVAAITADPFDPKALEQVMMQQSERIGSVQTQARAAFLDTITNMTPERRAEFAADLAEEMSKPRRTQSRGSGG